MQSLLVCCKHKTHLLLGTAAGHEFCQKLRHLLTLWLSHWPSEQGPEIELEDLHWSVAALCTQPELWTGLQHPVSVGATVRPYEQDGSQQQAWCFTVCCKVAIIACINSTIVCLSSITTCVKSIIACVNSTIACANSMIACAK